MNSGKSKSGGGVFYTPKRIIDFIKKGTVVYDAVIGNPPLVLNPETKREVRNESCG